MAVYKIFPEKSATIYSFYPTLNTGIDEILEVSTFESINDTSEVSRALIKFPSSQINTAFTLASGSTISANLKLFLANASSIPSNYSLDIKAIAQDWNRGTGRLGNVPITTDGVSWTYRSELNVNAWSLQGTYASGTTGSYSGSTPGGGVWYTNPAYNTTENYSPLLTSNDIDVNVTNTVNSWHLGSISNYGFLIKNAAEHEFNASASKYELKYFSDNTHTIYPPCLEIKWNDTTYSTGSLSVVTSSYFVATLNNNKAEYQQDSVTKFRVTVRDLYQPTTFRTSLSFGNQHSLPSSSYWSIKDLDTEEIVVDYDTVGTAIGCDNISNYFTVYMNGLEPERYYKILIKSILPSGETIVSDKDYIFKVIR